MDLVLTENEGNGGDLKWSGNDFAMIFGIENQPYLALFGGNPGFVTKNKVVDEQSFDFWGNGLLLSGNQSMQFNSLLEKKLYEVSLTSKGRIEIEECIKKDLSYLSEFATVIVSATIVSNDHILIQIKIIQNSGLTTVKIVNFRKQSNGDFRISDFNDDFYI